jgi:Fibronectin type III domain
MNLTICARISVFGLCTAVFAGCGNPQSPSRVPTATDRVPPLSTGFGTIAVAGASVAEAAPDLASCLNASAAAACFSAQRFRASDVVAGNAVSNQPRNLTASASGSTVTLTWIAPDFSDPPVVAYIIEAGSTRGSADLANFSTNSTATTFSATGVGNGTYYVRVRAANSAGVSGPSNEAILVVSSGSCVSPGLPSALAVASNLGGTVILTWGAGTGAPSSYIVEAGSSPGLANLVNADLGFTTTLTATGVQAGTYYVRVRAKNACGVSEPSNEVVLVVGGGATGTLSGRWEQRYSFFTCLLNPGVCRPGPTSQLAMMMDLTQVGIGVTGSYFLKYDDVIAIFSKEAYGRVTGSVSGSSVVLTFTPIVFANSGNYGGVFTGTVDTGSVRMTGRFAPAFPYGNPGLPRDTVPIPALDRCPSCPSIVSQFPKQ